MSQPSTQDSILLPELRQLIDIARERAAISVNAELTLLYWQLGNRIHREILRQERAGYGEQIVSSLGRQLTSEYGRGFSAKNLRHMIRFAETFPEEKKVSALRRQLSWTHIKSLIYLDDSLKRDFYIELSRLEGWSSRQLQQRIQSMLFERTAISRKPDETIHHELQNLRNAGQPSPQLLLKDPYVLDFLGLNDRYLELDNSGIQVAEYLIPRGLAGQTASIY